MSSSPRSKHYASRGVASTDIDPTSVRLAALAEVRAVGPVLGMSVNAFVNTAVDAYLVSPEVQSALREALDAEADRLALIRTLSGEDAQS